MNKKILIFSLLLALFAFGAQAESSDLGLPTLAPVELPAVENGEQAALYCGPTQGFFRNGETVLDLSKPFVYFGQHDCWAMAAPGTLDAMGPVGWMESAAALLPDEPQLTFEDALPAMVEEDSFLTDTPTLDAPVQLIALSRGAEVLLLAQFEDWLYVQYEGEETPIRAFLPASAVK